MPRGPAGGLEPHSPPVIGGGGGGGEPERRYVCISEGGAIMRAGAEMDSEKVGILDENEEIVALQEVILLSGTRRVECARGWVSVSAGDGTPILEELSEGTAPPDIRRTSVDSSAQPASPAGNTVAYSAVSPATEGVRSIQKDPALRREQLERFGTERELLLRYALGRLHKTQRLQLPKGQQLALLDSAQLMRIECQDVMRCMRTGDGLDLSTAVDAPGQLDDDVGDGTDDGESLGPEDAGEPIFALDGAQLAMASYETFVLSYNLLQPDSSDSGRLDVRVAEAEVFHGAGTAATGQLTHTTIVVGRMTARTTAKCAQAGSCLWDEDFEFIVADGCQTLELHLYVAAQDAAETSAVRSLGSIKVPLAAVFHEGCVEDWYDLSVSNGYKTRQTARVRLVLQFRSGEAGLPIDVQERMQVAFEISEAQHEEIVENLTLPDAHDAGVRNEGMSVEMTAKLQLRMQHRLAVPQGVCVGTCPHYRLLLLQNKRPRDFNSDTVFDEWQERQVSVVVNALLALVRRMDRSEREGLVEPHESSMLSDVERSLRNRFALVIKISHDYEASAGFPEADYTACLDELYEYSMEVYARHDRSYDLAPLRLPELDALLPSTRPIGSPESTPSPRGDQEAVPASVWESFRYPLNVDIYETLSAACFDHDSVGRHDELKREIIAAIERTRAHLGVTNEQQHLCLARQHFEEYLAAERENARDSLRGRAAIENERKEMLTALQDHIIVSTLQDQNLPSFDGSGLVSPATSEAAEEETRRMREGVIKPIMEHFGAVVEDYHRCDVDLLPRALRVYVALRHPEDPQTVVREAMTLAVVRLYERLSEDVERPISPEGLCMVVTKVLSAIDLEMEKYADVWTEFITGSDTVPDSTGLFIRAIGSRVRQDYETGNCPGAIDAHVVRAITLLQRLENKMLHYKALDPASRILAHTDARHGGASPYSKLVWAWIDNHGQQFQNTVVAFVEHESWEPEQISASEESYGGATPEIRRSGSLKRGHALTSFSIDGLFDLFQASMDTFFGFSIASDDMFLCLVEHIVSACLCYANGVVESCGDLLDIVPPSPPVSMCRRQTKKVTTTSEPDEANPLPSNSSICVRMNNLYDGLQRFILFFTEAKGRWVEFAALEYSQPLSMRRLDYLVGSVRRSFGDSINQLIDYLGVKVVYSDLRDTMMDGLYLPTVQDCRIDDALPALTARLRSLDALLTEAVVREVHDAVYRNFAGCFQRVLIDGGVHRIFTVADKDAFEEDFCAIKAEVHRFETLVDVDAIERLFTLLAMPTPNLIDFYEKTESQGSSVEGDVIYQSDTILRIISHRDERKARDFVKRALRVGRGAGGAGGSVTDGASPGRAHTASDLAAVYGNRTATMSHAKRRFS